jgi:thiamine transporter ThiT
MGLNIRTLITIFLVVALVLLFVPGDLMEKVPAIKIFRIADIQIAFRARVAQGFDDAREAARGFISGLVQNASDALKKRAHDQVDEEFNSVE